MIIMVQPLRALAVALISKFSTRLSRRLIFAVLPSGETAFFSILFNGRSTIPPNLFLPMLEAKIFLFV
jgi:hypothetical protein